MKKITWVIVLSSLIIVSCSDQIRRSSITNYNCTSEQIELVNKTVKACNQDLKAQDCFFDSVVLNCNLRK